MRLSWWLWGALALFVYFMAIRREYFALTGNYATDSLVIGSALDTANTGIANLNVQYEQLNQQFQQQQATMKQSSDQAAAAQASLAAIH
jgi:hypothetical protein